MVEVGDFRTGHDAGEDFWFALAWIVGGKTVRDAHADVVDGVLGVVDVAPDLGVVGGRLVIVELGEALVAADAQVGEEDAVRAEPARRERLVEVVLFAPHPVGQCGVPGQELAVQCSNLGEDGGDGVVVGGAGQELERRHGCRA